MTGRETQRMTFQIIGFGLVLIACAAFWLLAPWREWVQSLSGWVQDLGFAGVLLFGLIYILAVVLLAPSWPLTVLAGLIYGFWGVPIVVFFATIGATGAFFTARYIAREWVAGLIRDRPVFHSIDKAIEREGAKIVVLLRLSPAVPFNLQNYFFGITNVSALSYFIATLFGIIPGTTLYIYLGTLGKAVAAGNTIDVPQIALLVIGLVATIAALLIITRKAKKMLQEAGR